MLVRSEKHQWGSGELLAAIIPRESWTGFTVLQEMSMQYELTAPSRNKANIFEHISADLLLKEDFSQTILTDRNFPATSPGHGAPIRWSGNFQEETYEPFSSAGAGRDTDAPPHIDADFGGESQELDKASLRHIDMVCSFNEHFQRMGQEEDKNKISVLLRGTIPVRGIKMLQIRFELHRWYNELIRTCGSIAEREQKEFAFELIRSKWYEDKLAAILFMQEMLIFRGLISFADMPRLEDSFRGDHIKVYKVCDHFAEKVLAYLARQSEKENIRFEQMMDVLFSWTYADNIWQSRTAMLVLCNYATNVMLHARMMESVDHVLARKEEEAKSVAGGMLRSISEVDPVIVLEFLSSTANMRNMSATALQKAISRLTIDQRVHFRILRRDSLANFGR